ncbi:MAG: hypothetical protein PHF51_02620 [Candidatus ainarchaeum sp.]|nr:hypothetical protein [Candidatus ainarchaeum sp.]
MADEQYGQEAEAPKAAPAAPPREEYETIKLETVNYGTNNFIEVAKKKAPNGNLFISISKGWYPKGTTEKRYRAGIGFPLEQELIDKIMGSLNSVLTQ